MPSIKNLVDKLRVDYPQFTFSESDCFSWSPNEKTIYFSKKDDKNDYSPDLLHELAHALLNHSNYNSDIELIVPESQNPNRWLHKPIAFHYAVATYKLALAVKALVIHPRPTVHQLNFALLNIYP